MSSSNILIIPYTGRGGVGKDYTVSAIMKILEELRFHVYRFDSSSLAKEFCESLSVIAPDNARLKTAMHDKTDDYRNMLINVIDALDICNIRIDWLISRIRQSLDQISAYHPAYLDHEQPVFFFINIREPENMRKLFDWTLTHDATVGMGGYSPTYVCRCLYISGDDTDGTSTTNKFANTSKDLMDFESELKKCNVLYFEFTNNHDPKIFNKRVHNACSVLIDTGLNYMAETGNALVNMIEDKEMSTNE